MVSDGEHRARQHICGSSLAPEGRSANSPAANISGSRNRMSGSRNTQKSLGDRERKTLLDRGMQSTHRCGLKPSCWELCLLSSNRDGFRPFALKVALLAMATC
jgi:hypothetical protein